MKSTFNGKSVLIVLPDVFDYRVPFFEKLRDLGEKSQIDYQVRAKSISPEAFRKNANHPDSYFRQIPVKEHILCKRSIVRQKVSIDLNKTDLIIAEYAIRNLIIYKWIFLNRPKRLAMWGHGKTYTKSNTKIEEWLKNKLLNRTDWFFGYTDKGIEHAIANGFPKDRTTTVQNSTDTQTLKNVKSQVTQAQVDSYRLEKGIGTGPIAVFIGSFEPSKRINFLLTAAKQIQKSIPNFELLLFGSGPEFEKVRLACSENLFMKYCGKATVEEQAIASNFAQIIMMPGRIGLVAVDSLAMGLPIVSTFWKFHAPEAEYLVPGKNSIFFEDDVDTYSQGIIRLLKDQMKIFDLKMQCIKDSELYSIEIMANNFHEGVVKLLNENENSSIFAFKTFLKFKSNE